MRSYINSRIITSGPLIEVAPPLRREAGYRWPVRITVGVASLVTPTTQEVGEGQSLDARLWDTLATARTAISNAERQELAVPFEVSLGESTILLWACFDTTHGPAIHIKRRKEH